MGVKSADATTMPLPCRCCCCLFYCTYIPGCRGRERGFVFDVEAVPPGYSINIAGGRDEWGC